ncbi:MAG: hypothetical protein D6689_00855 [Deltaproteobacteria bacterium]|nr:MAG: hypothetical protein D6689_00855 [Deltaproteobacteria bacterium]
MLRRRCEIAAAVAVATAVPIAAISGCARTPPAAAFARADGRGDGSVRAADPNPSCARADASEVSPSDPRFTTPLARPHHRPDPGGCCA